MPLHNRATGSPKNNNRSGLVLGVYNFDADRSWLLTGDADYRFHNPLYQMPNLAAVVVPHHGADMKTTRRAPPPVSGADEATYRRLIYSFGPGNKNAGVQHPTAVTVERHQKAGWNHSGWLPSLLPGATILPGSTTANGDVLATAMHSTTHLGGAVIGWTAAPTVPVTFCPACGATALLTQA